MGCSACNTRACLVKHGLLARATPLLVCRIRFRVPLGSCKSDDKDKKQASWIMALVFAFGGILLGLVFSFIEYTRPLQTFRREAQRLAKGELDQLHPSRFRGAFRKIASDLNDGIDRVAARGRHSTQGCRSQAGAGRYPRSATDECVCICRGRGSGLFRGF